MTYREMRIRRTEAHGVRKAEWSARDERIRQLWPLKSVRDIAVDLDVTAQAVAHRASLMDLPSRPFARQP